MTHEDTERFLEQLAQAWPRDAERDAMLAELRDHLLAIEEDDSLAADEREAALVSALTECGDARRLVEKLRGVIQQRKRRWIMRVSTAAAVAGIATVLGLATYWPSPAPTPLVAVAQAQQAEAKPAAVNTATITAGGQDANNQKTQAKLGERIEATFLETSYEQVIDFLGHKLGVEVYLDRRAMDEAGVEKDANVTINLKQVRGDMLLDLVLQQVKYNEIDYFIRDGIVVITSADNLIGASEVKAYPVADLLRLYHADPRAGTPGPAGDPSLTPGAMMPAGGVPGGSGLGGGGFGGAMAGGMGGPIVVGGSEYPAEVQQLVKVLQNSVAPDSWSDVGGHGTITYYGEMLIVRQNARTHREIDKVLTMLRETAARRPGKPG